MFDYTHAHLILLGKKKNNVHQAFNRKHEMKSILHALH